MALGLVPAEPQLQHGQLGLSGAADTQEMAANLCTEATHWGQNRDVGGFHPSGYVSALAPVSPEPAPGVTLPQERAKEQLTSPAVIVWAQPQGWLLTGLCLPALVPWVPPSHRSSAGRGSCLVPVLNPAPM